MAYEIASLESAGATPPEPARSNASIASAIAYIIIPKMAFADPEKLVQLWTRGTPQEQSALYVLGCSARQVEPLSEDARLFRFHHGELDPKRDYYLLEFPPPPPLPPEEAAAENPTLGAYFSAVIRHRETGGLQYFVLGQAPRVDLGGTTFRCITNEGVNKNLGIGPPPSFDAFLNKIRDQISKESGEPAAPAMPASRVQRSTAGYGKKTLTRETSFGVGDVVVAVSVAVSAGLLCYALHHFLFAFLKERTSGFSHGLMVIGEAVACVIAFFLCGYAAFKIRAATQKPQ